VNTRDPWLARVVERYDAGVDAYDDIWSPVILPPAEALVAALPISAARRVLDVGCGSGALAGALRRAAPRAHVVGIDPSEGMLQRARARGVTAVRADAAALPVAPGSVDAVVLAYMLFHLADPTAGVRAAREALRPGGVVGIVTWEREEAARADEMVTAALDAAGAPPAPTVSDHSATDSTAKVGAIAAAAGLRTERAWTMTIEHVFTPAALLALRVGGGVSRCRFESLAPDVRAAVVAEVGERLAELEPDAFRFRGVLVLVIATRP
jgi:SAM-dependent methyltransferase